MIPLEGKHYAVYERCITNPNTSKVTCALCGRRIFRLWHSINAVGWVRFKVNRQVRERYCPKCAVKIWPLLHADAMAILRSR